MKAFAAGDNSILWLDDMITKSTLLLLPAVMCLPMFVIAAEPMASAPLQHQHHDKHQHHQKEQHAAIEQSKPHVDPSQHQAEHSAHQVERLDHSKHKMRHHDMAHSAHTKPQHQPTKLLAQQPTPQQSTEFSPTALATLMPAAMVPLADWRQANQQVLEIGGWQFYLQEAASSDGVATQPQQEQHHGHH
jgi:hypothetical protein